MHIQFLYIHRNGGREEGKKDKREGQKRQATNGEEGKRQENGRK